MTVACYYEGVIIVFLAGPLYRGALIGIFYGGPIIIEMLDYESENYSSCF